MASAPLDASTCLCRIAADDSAFPFRKAYVLDPPDSLAMTIKREGSITVRGSKYQWSLYRQPRYATERGTTLGMAILVEPMEPRTRSLILEFDVDRSRHRTMPQHQRTRIPDVRLAECIERALVAGWDPEF
jgi:hypothetical protein